MNKDNLIDIVENLDFVKIGNIRRNEFMGLEITNWVILNPLEKEIDYNDIKIWELIAEKFEIVL